MNRRLVLFLCIPFALACLLAMAPSADAGGCSYYGGAPSHGYSAGYSYGSSYGRSYWAGGYYAGDHHYTPGYYSPGYYSYPSYPKKSYQEPYFLRYVAVAPLVELPSYGAYYTTPPPAPPVAPAAPAAPAVAAPPASDAKLDRLLALAEKTDGRLARVEARVDVLESGRRAPAPEVAATPPRTAAEDAPSMFHAACASCHDAKTAAKRGKGFAFFITTEAGPQMAGVTTEGKPRALGAAELKKIDERLADGTMPPEDAVGSDGKPIRLSSAGRDAMRRFLATAMPK